MSQFPQSHQTECGRSEAESGSPDSTLCAHRFICERKRRKEAAIQKISGVAFGLTYFPRCIILKFYINDTVMPIIY